MGGDKSLLQALPREPLHPRGDRRGDNLCEEGLDIEDIEKIEFGVASPVLRTIAQPEDEKARPKTGYAAQFSGPFTVATALVGGGGLVSPWTTSRTRTSRTP